MKNWLDSLNGTITLSLLALLSFLGRAFLDWRYEYAIQDPAGVWDTIGVLTYLALVGGWVWGLLSAAKGNRKGLISNLILILLLDVGLGIATYVIFCPPWTGCVGWPNVWPWNLSNLILGLIATYAIAVQLKQTKFPN